MIWVDLAVERVHWSPYGVQWSPVESIWIMGGTDKTSKGGEPNFQYPGLSGGAIGAGILSGTSQALPMGTGMLSGTGQTLPVGPVFRCTEGNQWDIRQLPPPVGFIGPLIAITLGIVGLVLDKYCIGIRVSNEVYKQGSKYCRQILGAGTIDTLHFSEHQ